MYYKKKTIEGEKYMFVSHKQNAQQYRNIKTDYKSFKRVEQFKHFVRTHTNQYCIHEAIKE
jgi:hypothetical protein